MITPTEYAAKMYYAYVGTFIPDPVPAPIEGRDYSVKVEDDNAFEYWLYDGGQSANTNRVRQMGDMLVDEWTEDGVEWNESARAPNLDMLAAKAEAMFAPQ